MIDFLRQKEFFNKAKVSDITFFILCEFTSSMLLPQCVAWLMIYLVFVINYCDNDKKRDPQFLVQVFNCIFLIRLLNRLFI